MIVYGDESGWTGPDLLDEAQPVLALATLAISPQEAAELRDRFFGGFTVDEVKFSGLNGEPAGQAKILEFLKWVVSNSSRQGHFVVHKRFALLGKLIDTVIENAIYSLGGDLYASGAHITMMRAFHYGLPKFGGDRFYLDLLRRWQTLARKPSKENLDNFFWLVSGLAYSPQLERLLKPLRVSREVLGDQELLGCIRRSDLDVLATSLWTVSFSWNKTAAPTDRIEVVFDEQSKLQSEWKAWKVLLDKSFNVGPPVVARVPVVDAFSFGKSVTYPGIQLADILSGSLRFALESHAWLDAGKPDPLALFRADVLRQVGELPNQSIWPGDSYKIENSLGDYEKAQALIDATVDSVQSRAPRRRS
jgi:hypothetical protein